ncbi:MAG: acyltransferase family protein [Clostridiales bacterium]|nr:acyltransferase family protein [Clostridiales bacterium]
MRKHYIDNLRWMVILLLIPYHVAQAFNTWGEPNYIIFNSSRTLSSIIVFFSPFIMPLLFLLAGMSTRFALKKRSVGQYISERCKRLIVPLLFGVIALLPVMTFLADKYNYHYEGSFLSHYRIFFTRVTDFTGADGGFSFGQFWFLLYLFVISLLAVGIIAIQKKCIAKRVKTIPTWVILLFGLPLPLFNDWLSIGGKSLVEYLYVFLLGYYVFSDDAVIERISKWKVPFLLIGVVSGILDVYLFLWSGTSYATLNTIARFVTEWFMILGLLSFGSEHINFNNKISAYLSRTSFAVYSLHFIFVVVTQYLFADVFAGNKVLLFLVPVILSYILTFLASEVFLRVPVLRFLIGVKPEKKK